MSPSPSDDGGVTVERATERNRLLLALPPDEYARLDRLLETVPFGVRHAFYESGEHISHVYFPQAGVVSQTVGLNGGAVVVEVATVGREGIVGLPVFLNGGSSLERVFGQISG